MGIKLMVDVCPLLNQRTGIGWYIYHILNELKKSPDVDDITGICGTRILSMAEVEGLLDEKTALVATEKILRRSPLSKLKQWVGKNIPGMHRLHLYLQARVIQKDWDKYKNYVFWGGSYHVPDVPMPKVVTIHDLSHIHYPEFHPPERVKQLNRYLPGVVSRVDAVTVVSEFTRQDVLSNFNLKESEVHVVSPAADQRFAERNDEQISIVRKKYLLPERFILSVGTLEPRKNLRTLLKAYALLPETLRKSCPLILVGGKGWLMEEPVDFLASFGLGDEVRWLGYVPDEYLPALYQCSDLFVYISLFEGFGMPLLEAMIAGVPVLTSDRGVMLEVVGDAACCVDPVNEQLVASAIQHLLDDLEKCQVLTKKGRVRGASYSWAQGASLLLQVLWSIRINSAD